MNSGVFPDDWQFSCSGKKKVKLISTQKCQQFISVTFLQINPVLGILSLISKPRCGWDLGSPLGLQGGGAVAGSCTEELGVAEGPDEGPLGFTEDPKISFFW